MERNEVSLHEVKIYCLLRSQPGRWLTNQEIGAALTGVAPRTVRAHTKRLVTLGLVNQAEVFPAHRYQWSEMGAKRNLGYSQRLEQAAAVFGLE
jgi:predicted ArsR family transcriptional regulator